MTESQYTSFIKSALRAKSRFWPPSSEVKREAKRGFGIYQCAKCGNIVRAKDTVIDHIEPVVDPFQNPSGFSWDLFINRLFCEKDGLQLLCLPCHVGVKTSEENLVRKQVINYAKQFPAEYNSWRSMWRRCNEITNNKFHLYGGRGIKVCDAWSPKASSGEAFQTFLRDMGPRPEGTTLDRLDGDGDYTPENCRWADIFEQNRNRKSVMELEIDNEIYTFAEACEKYGISTSTAQYRMSKGKSLPEIFKEPPKRTILTEDVQKLREGGKSVEGIATAFGVSRGAIKYHLAKIDKLKSTKDKKEKNEV